MANKKYVKSPMNYTGGKYKLLHQIEPLFPEDINLFVDLFTGGGNIAVNVKANKIVANDCEENIIGIYQTFQKYDNVDELIGQIEEIIKTYGLTIDNMEAYNKFRNDYNSLKTSQGNYPHPLSSYNINILLYVLICVYFNINNKSCTDFKYFLDNMLAVPYNYLWQKSKVFWLKGRL